MADALGHYVAEAERATASRLDRDPRWMTGARQDALARFRALGFPTTRDEEWRFTSVSPIAETPFTLAENGASLVGSADLDRLRVPAEAAATLVFVNGRSVESGSDVGRLPARVRVGSFAGAVAGGTVDVEAHLARVATMGPRAFTELNTAFLTDGAVVCVPDSCGVDGPIHLLFVSTGVERPTMAHPRVVVVMGANSQACVVESYIGVNAGASLTNAVTEVVVGENARLDHYKLQREGPDTAHVGAMYLRAARSASVACHSIALGGSLVRNDVVAVLDGDGAECTLNGLYLGDRRMLVDNHTTIDHAKPHCHSREVYNGILADRARAVFNGKIVVRPDAQQTDAKQTNKALLLSEEAQINTKPQLEIFANDVKCTHGAAIGQMDDEAIFYLRTRGLGEREARRLLIRAFAGDILNRLPLTALAGHLATELMHRLPGSYA
jgi:Fe-S cluster assembly protein SufD